MNRTMFTSTA